MNQDTFNKALDACVEYRKQLTEKNNEVARLREEARNWHQHYRDEASKAQKCEQAFIEQEKEVARLRERIAELESGWDEEAYQRRHQNLE